jgi:hypothetical protein
MAAPEEHQVMYDEASSGNTASKAAGEGAAPGDGSDQAPVDRMIIWNADLQLRVKDAAEAMGLVQGVAREMGGYTISTETWLQNDQTYARVSLRVPADRFDEAMQRLRGLAIEVTHESANSEDVTDEYVDLKSRLRHLEAKEAQLLTFLDKAEDTEAVLAVYDQLSQTQLEIEQIKGRMEYLEKLSAMATISVTLSPEEPEPVVVQEGWRPGRTLREAARALVSTLQVLGNAAIWFAIYVLPVLVLIALPVVLIVWLLRRRSRRTTRSA